MVIIMDTLPRMRYKPADIRYKREKVDPLTSGIIRATKNGDVNAIKRLLGEGASIESKDAHGRSLLGVAAKRGHVEAFQFLLEQGLDENARNAVGESVFMDATYAAVYFGKDGVLKRMLSKDLQPHFREKCDPELNVVSFYGDSALDIAKLDEGTRELIAQEGGISGEQIIRNRKKKLDDAQ